MKNEIQHIEGVILKTIPFQDYHQIFRLFTPNRGVVSAIVKGGMSHRKGRGALATPMMRVVMEFREGRSELLTCAHMEQLDSYLALRERLDWLQAGCALIESVLQSQSGQKPADALYRLLNYSLTHIPKMEDPMSMVSSFLLKTLRHDGFFAYEGQFDQVSIVGGQCYPPDQVPIGPDIVFQFDKEESDWLLLLTHCRSTDILKQVICTEMFHEKVGKLFKEMVM